jgi:hypothetical protein
MITTGHLIQATEIMTKPVNNAQFCIYLNSAFMDRTIEFNGNGKVVDSKSKDLLMDLDNSDIEFKDNKFIIESAEDDEKKVTGVTYVIANMFIEWVSKYNKEKYQLSSYGTNDNVTDVSSFSNKPLNEIVYSNWINYGNSAGYVITERLDKNRYMHFANHGFGSYYSSIDSKFNSSNDSFRMMKLPENEE